MNSENNNVSKREILNDILKKVAQCEHVINYKTCTNIDNDKGDGFLGEFFKGSFVDLDTQKEYFVAIKRSLPASSFMRTALDVAKAYEIENHFYSEVFPALDAFQNSHKVKDAFRSVPYYYFGSLEPYCETVVMKDLLQEGYRLHDKHLPIPSKNIALIFETYGKFHALSMAFKDQHYDEFNKLTSKIPKYFSIMTQFEGFGPNLINVFERTLNALDAVEHYQILKKLESYRNGHIFTLFKELINYRGDYSTIIHGDCWSNNTLHKYNEEGEPIDVKLLDFQLCGVGTPVYDLSYFFYSGAEKADLDKLDHYLDIYYKSFETFAKCLGSDPNKLLPKDQLKEDWKQYAKMGLLMGLAVIATKLISKDKMSSIATSNAESFDVLDYQDVSDAGEIYFRKNVIPLMEHAYEYGVL